MIKISASFSKKVPGTQQFSSDAVHLGVEIEVPDKVLADQEQFSASVRRLFAQARAEVEQQVGTPPIRNGTGNSRPSDNGRTNGRGQPASPRQIDFLLSLGRRNANMSPADILREAGVEKLTDLTKSQASALIDRFNQKGAA